MPEEPKGSIGAPENTGKHDLFSLFVPAKRVEAVVNGRTLKSKDKALAFPVECHELTEILFWKS